MLLWRTGQLAFDTSQGERVGLVEINVVFKKKMRGLLIYVGDSSSIIRLYTHVETYLQRGKETC